MSRYEEIDEKVLKKILEEEIEFRRIRRESADWSFIEKQPPRIKAALEYYIETGDIRTSSKIAGLNLCVFRNILRQARIPVIT
ncbi:MAG: hypothetical protein DRJ49_06515 [Thermoprotei archaeon]|mgnify:CR=1 FL=1|nr:MAG: hypothetical protein DRJ49_06515 [Thermoprotei archaeon]